MDDEPPLAASPLRVGPALRRRAMRRLGVSSGDGLTWSADLTLCCPDGGVARSAVGSGEAVDGPRFGVACAWDCADFASPCVLVRGVGVVKLSAPACGAPVWTTGFPPSLFLPASSLWSAITRSSLLKDATLGPEINFLHVGEWHWQRAGHHICPHRHAMLHEHRQRTRPPIAIALF